MKKTPYTSNFSIIFPLVTVIKPTFLFPYHLPPPSLNPTPEISCYREGDGRKGITKKNMCFLDLASYTTMQFLCSQAAVFFNRALYFSRHGKKRGVKVGIRRRNSKVDEIFPS